MSAQFIYRNDSVPSPVVIITVECPMTGNRIDNLDGLIDTGADRTVFPKALIDQLQAPESNRSYFVDFLGNIIQLPLFQIGIAIKGLKSVLVEVASTDVKEEILIGRDVVNQFHVILDGPRKLLEII